MKTILETKELLILWINMPEFVFLFLIYYLISAIGLSFYRHDKVKILSMNKITKTKLKRTPIFESSDMTVDTRASQSAIAFLSRWPVAFAVFFLHLYVGGAVIKELCTDFMN